MKFHTQKRRGENSRLDGLLFFVLLLWLATAMLVVLLYKPRTARALHPQSTQDVIASVISPGHAPSLDVRLS